MIIRARATVDIGPPWWPPWARAVTCWASGVTKCSSRVCACTGWSGVSGGGPAARPRDAVQTPQVAGHTVRRWPPRVLSATGWAPGSDELADERAWNSGAYWEVAPKMPPWATADAASSRPPSVARGLAAGPEPLAALPVQHEMIWITQVNGTMMRRLAAG